MSAQPEALRLADELSMSHLSYHINHAAAAELRRLHAENERIGPLAERVLELKAQRDALLEALKLARAIIGHPDDAHSKFIAAAIAKAEEQT